MNSTTDLHPDVVRDAIRCAARHEAKRRNVDLIHEVCAHISRVGGKDFSLKTIGDEVESRGGPKAKTLWNPQSADYRKLIEAWQAFCGGSMLRETAKSGAADSLLVQIPDPATRIIVGQALKERNELRAQLNLLKGNTRLTIDRRPSDNVHRTEQSHDGSVTVEILTNLKLNPLEREALEHALSAEFWNSEGWLEEKNGRLVKQLGQGRTRTVFKPGFTSAIRKLLSSR
jgi:hypothetical protein